MSHPRTSAATGTALDRCREVGIVKIATVLWVGIVMVRAGRFAVSAGRAVTVHARWDIHERNGVHRA